MGSRIQKRNVSMGRGQKDLTPTDRRIQVHPAEPAWQLRAAQEAHARYTAFYNLAPIAYVSFDESGRIHELNSTAARMIGIERGKLCDFPFKCVLLPEDIDVFLCHLQRCRTSA